MIGLLGEIADFANEPTLIGVENFRGMLLLLLLLLL